MADMKENETSIKDFYQDIKEKRGISDIWGKVLDVIRESCGLSETDDCLKLFCIYFSLLDDGNTCISLNPDTLLEKWVEKWSGLCLASEDESFKTDEERSADITDYKTKFGPIIKTGIEGIQGNRCSSVIGDANKLFIIKEIKGEQWLFTTKLFNAKVSIEKRVKVLFPSAEKIAIPESDKKDVKNVFSELTDKPEKPDKKVELEMEQAEVIIRGQKSNLIITGGPGTGKTTAICYLLWNLFKEKDNEGIPYLDYQLYMAAPSGKAADRMKESISDSLNDFRKDVKEAPENSEIINKLVATGSYTIHRLLSYDPKENCFKFNANNQFDDKSIFIIDEASMVDIHLFKCLLEAIPDKARVFILGDKDQLPSVQAGAVLGELLSKRENSVVNLIVSKRFKEDSEVGRLKKFIENEDDLPAEDSSEMKEYGTWLSETKQFSFKRKPKDEKAVNYPVFFYSLKEVKVKGEDPTKRKQLKEILGKWSQAFCDDLPGKALLDRNDSDLHGKLKNLWYLTNEAKILCAERQGFRGVEEVNSTISKIVCINNGIEIDDEGYFLGQPLIMTHNQKEFQLSNGDTGIVVSFGGSPTKYLMVEKKCESGEASSAATDPKALIFRLGNFMFYPLSLLPQESLETAYAITIHKSQGSGYENIMIILPEQIGHPLLNRQIVYTAVTRTKLNTYIITNREVFNYAKKTLIKRDTLIELSD